MLQSLAHAGLFSGIGGFSLAAQWMGWQNVFEVEIDPFCRQVLHKNFPHSQLFTDVCTFDGFPFRRRIDVLSGGFPCQPWSDAGKGLGTADPRHLWPQFLRLIREIQPRFVVGENVRGLLSWGGGIQFERVCADLEAEGYTVLPLLLPAVGVGAPHKRDRFWFVAHATGQRCEELCSVSGGQESQLAERSDLCGPAAHANGFGWGAYESGLRQWQSDATGCPAADAASQRQRAQQPDSSGTGAHEGYAIPNATPSSWRLTEPPLCGSNDGLPARLVRTASPRAKQLKAYGNAIVPQVAFEIFQAIQATL